MTVDEAKEEVELALNALRPVFIPEAQLSFIMRVPGKSNSHMIISNDNLEELTEILAAEVGWRLDRSERPAQG